MVKEDTPKPTTITIGGEQITDLLQISINNLRTLILQLSAYELIPDSIRKSNYEKMYNGEDKLIQIKWYLTEADKITITSEEIEIINNSGSIYELFSISEISEIMNQWKNLEEGIS